MLQIFNRFLKSNHVPFPRNVFFNGSFSAPSRSRIPAQDAEACSSKRLGTLLSTWYSGLGVFGHEHHGKLDRHFLHSTSGATLWSLDRILPKWHNRLVRTRRLRRNQKGFCRLGEAGQSVRVRSRVERDGQPQVKLVQRCMHSLRRCKHIQWNNDQRRTCWMCA